MFLYRGVAGGPAGRRAGGGAILLPEQGGDQAAAGETEPRAEGQDAGDGGPGPLQTQILHRRPRGQTERGRRAAGDWEQVMVHGGKQSSVPKVTINRAETQ